MLGMCGVYSRRVLRVGFRGVVVGGAGASSAADALRHTLHLSHIPPQVNHSRARLSKCFQLSTMLPRQGTPRYFQPMGHSQHRRGDLAPQTEFAVASCRPLWVRRPVNFLSRSIDVVRGSEWMITVFRLLSSFDRHGSVMGGNVRLQAT